MHKSILSLVFIFVVLIGCNKKQDPFQVSKQHIGLLTDSTQVKDLKNIYHNDSIVNFIDGDEFTGHINDIEIYEKGGKKLLTLTPKQALDSTSFIKEIQIIDSRFKTDKNISTLSTFKDITDSYKISKINNSINSIIVTINEINTSFIIDKKELSANLRYDMDLKIEPTHIPNTAKIKYFFINWNKK